MPAPWGVEGIGSPASEWLPCPAGSEQSCSEPLASTVGLERAGVGVCFVSQLLDYLAELPTRTRRGSELVELLEECRGAGRTCISIGLDQALHDATKALWRVGSEVAESVDARHSESRGSSRDRGTPVRTGASRPETRTATRPMRRRSERPSSVSLRSCSGDMYPILPLHVARAS